MSTASPIHTRKLYRIGEGFLQRLLVKSLAFWLSIVATIFLFLGTTGYILGRDSKKYWAEIVSQATFAHWSPPIHSSNIKTWIILPYQLIIALLIIAAFIVWSIRWRHIGGYNQLRRILPRLFGGILVGYIPLMSSEDIWKWLLILPPVPATGIWLLALVFSYGYLWVEARGILSDCTISALVKRDIAIRSGQVFLIGWAEAYVIGFILCEFLGFTALNGLGSALGSTGTHYAIKGWIGTLVPKVILLYAPLALFLGILVQFIWEEKTVTQPL